MSVQRVIKMAALLIAVSGAAHANSEPPPSFPPPPAEPAAAVRSAGAVSMDQAVKIAEQHFHARVVKAETERADGRTVYVLRLLNEAGRVWTVRVDASNGELH